jgi:hypothetical protein
VPLLPVLNTLYQHVCLALAMAGLPAIPDLRLVLENDDFGAAILPNTGASCSPDCRRPCPSPPRLAKVLRAAAIETDTAV